MSTIVAPDPDAALIERMAAGDEAALAELYDRRGGLAFSLAYAILGSSAEAEEAVADAFLQVWTSVGSFDASRSSAAGWLTMITRARALDRLRVERRRSALLVRAGPDVLEPTSPEDPDAGVERREAGDRVAAALEGLTPAQRRVLELSFFGGLSHSEIATELDEPLGTVKTRIRSAMEKLRATLVTP